MTEIAKRIEIKSEVWSGGNEEKRFRDLALRYQEIGAASGVRIIPFRGPDLPLFNKATPEERKKATDFLESILTIHEETLAAKEVPINTRQLLWRALRRLSLIPSPEFFDLITDDDVITIYDQNNQAIFWNLQFFKYVSFSVEDMFFGLWYQDVKRDPAILEKLYKMSLDIIAGKITGTFVTGVPAHEIEEIGTLECLKSMMEIPYGSVLTKNGKLGGMLIVKKLKLID